MFFFYKKNIHLGFYQCPKNIPGCVNFSTVFLHNMYIKVLKLLQLILATSFKMQQNVAIKKLQPALKQICQLGKQPGSVPQAWFKQYNYYPPKYIKIKNMIKRYKKLHFLQHSIMVSYAFSSGRLIGNFFLTGIRF